MAKKKNQSNGNEKHVGNGRKNKEDDGRVTVVLKTDLHCEGCAGKVVKAVRSLKGVESAKTGDYELKKITVIGKVDPVELRQKVEEKIKKKVELISPVNDGEKSNQLGGGGGQGKQQKHQTAAVQDENNHKQFPVTTTALKVALHCQGCIEKIQKLVIKTEGFMDMSIDKSNDLVVVKGGIDVDALVDELKGKLKRKVEIVPAKKDGGGGGEKKENGGGEKKENGGGGDGERRENGGGGRSVDLHNMGYFVGQGQYTYPQYVNRPEYAINYMHATQMFNDENPNACVVM